MGFLSKVFKSVKKVAAPVLKIATGDFLGAADSIGAQLATSAANATSAKSVKEQMAFQQYNSDTAYQRAMEDMRKAGLNPILAYQQGGASTPGGSSFAANDGAALNQAANSAISTRQQKELNDTIMDINKMELNNKKEVLNNLVADRAKTVADTNRSNIDAALSNTIIAKTQQETKNLSASAKQINLNNELLGYQLPTARYDNLPNSIKMNIIDRLSNSSSAKGFASTLKKAAGSVDSIISNVSR